MWFQSWLDALPVGGVFLVFALVGMATFEAGYRHGRWWQSRTPDEKEGPTGMIVGSLLALMAFLLAIAMGMASDRFDTRRGIVLAEANTVSTTYLRAGYLPEPTSGEIRGLLRDYARQRVVSGDLAELSSKIARSEEINDQLWALTENLARTTPDSHLLALYVESLNQMFDLHADRVTLGVHARVPVTVIIILLLGSMLTLSMVGYNAGLTRRRSPLTAVVLITVLGAVISMVIDLDRGRDGFLTVSQQPLIDLQHQLGVDVAPAGDPSTPR